GRPAYRSLCADPVWPAEPVPAQAARGHAYRRRSRDDRAGDPRHPAQPVPAKARRQARGCDRATSAKARAETRAARPRAAALRPQDERPRGLRKDAEEPASAEAGNGRGEETGDTGQQATVARRLRLIAEEFDARAGRRSRRRAAEAAPDERRRSALFAAKGAA